MKTLLNPLLVAVESYMEILLIKENSKSYAGSTNQPVFFKNSKVLISISDPEWYTLKTFYKYQPYYTILKTNNSKENPLLSEDSTNKEMIKKSITDFDLDGCINSGLNK